MGSGSSKKSSSSSSSSSSKMVRVVILGSSGNVGQAVIQSLSTKHSNVSVVAGVRNPAKDAAQKLSTFANVTTAQADLSKPETLDGAVKGADVVFINTPGDINRTQLAINGVEAAKRQGVKHVVVVSVLTAEVTGTTFGNQFLPLEHHVKHSGLHYTLLRLPFFIDNNWGNAKTIKEHGKFYGPAAPDAPFTPVAVQDIGEAAAAILAEPSKHHNKTYKLTSKTTTHAGISAAFSAVLGKPIEYVQVPYANAKEAFLGLGIPEWQTDGILELFKLFDAKSPVTNDPTNDIKTLTGHEATTVEQWIAQSAGGFK